MKSATILSSLGFMFAVLCHPGFAATNQSLNFQEVFDLLRANIQGMDESQLSHAAAQGLIDQLHPKVTLVTNDARSVESTNSILRSTVYDTSFAYIRVETIKRGVEQAVIKAYEGLEASNRLKGLVLDLRFATGQDYGAAATFADWFFATEQPLLDYGEGVKKSTGKTKSFTRPLAILINGRTAGAAEAFVGILRQAEIGVSIGSPTAGLASMAKQFTLKSGQQLRVAVAPIKVGNGQPIPLTGIKPDISLPVSIQDETVYMEDPYRDITRLARSSRTAGATNQLTASTNRPRTRINEAELVRMLREGESFDGESNTLARGSETVVPVIHDPALVRALDLLKGLSVLRQARTL
jgi:hypothetical protein